ncbi:hypothetical protein [Chitinophaga sp. MM2321]|uniref:hypothetical protein n=1 Tax=Chitinophaga sp. MM2321 TaxID=3137178 RepID=UPI0032D59D3C
MRFKKALSILIFSLGLLMLALRPYSVLQLVKQQGMSDHPIKISTLLQRLVTKKDEHPYLVKGETAEEPAGKVKISLPMQILIFLCGHMLSLLALLANRNNIGSITTVFQLCPENSYYKRLSRFQI